MDDYLSARRCQKHSATNLTDAHALKSSNVISTATHKILVRKKAHPPRIKSNCLLPVEILTTRFLTCPSSTAVMKPELVGYNEALSVYTCDNKEHTREVIEVSKPGISLSLP